MPKQDTASSHSAAPVSEQGFTYTHNEFFAQSSGGQQHRRANLDELRTHFQSGTDKDHPAHWFEAQLLHYGLLSSKVKATARMRLYDAVNAGGLKVPTHLSALERKLKKEWTRQDREARKDSGSTTKEVVTGSKRKAETDAESNKKSKTTAARRGGATPASSRTTTKPDSAPRSTARARRGNISQAQARTADQSAQESATPKPRTKQTARRGGGTPASSRDVSAPHTSARPTARARRGGISQGQGRGSGRQDTEESATPRPRTKQTARRSRPFMSGRIMPSTPEGYSDQFLHEAPPPYISCPEDDSDVEMLDPEDDYDTGRGQQQDLAPLGLLNGDYDVDCPRVDGEWPGLADGYELTLTLAGTQLWGSFNLGVYEGILRIDERPRRSSHEKIWFRWRGRENEGQIFFGDNNRGWLKFLGDGKVEGWLDGQSIKFTAERVPGQGTRSSVGATELRREWDEEYSEMQYERENRARWGGSGSWW